MKPQHLFFLLLLAGVGCTPTPQAENREGVGTDTKQAPSNGIYYWKTVFELNDTERDFLNEHQVKRLYVRFFDVVPAVWAVVLSSTALRNITCSIWLTCPKVPMAVST